MLYLSSQHTIQENPEIFSIIKSNMPIIQQDERLKRIFPCSKFIKSKRQPNNLKKILTIARFDEISVIPEVKKCIRHNCGLCVHLLEGSTYIFNCGKRFNVYESMNCEVKNVIYVIRCHGCNKE